MLTLDQAGKIVDAALAKGTASGFQPLCVVVLDSGGHALALKRDERASVRRYFRLPGASVVDEAEAVRRAECCRAASSNLEERIAAGSTRPGGYAAANEKFLGAEHNRIANGDSLGDVGKTDNRGSVKAP